MRKGLLLILALLFLCSCKSRWLEDELIYIKAKDVTYYLTHGTHLVLICKEKQEGVRELLDEVEKYEGITIMYYPSEKISDEVKNSLGAFSGEYKVPLVALIKQGECIAVYSEDEINQFEEIDRDIEALVQELNPGCWDC